MTNAMATKKLETIISGYYGADALTCDAITIEWAADKLADSDGATVAAKAWKRVNAKRERLGKYTSIPGYKSRLWDAYFAK